MRLTASLILLLLLAAPAFAEGPADMVPDFGEAIFMIEGGAAFAPRAVKAGSVIPVRADGIPLCWSQYGADGYFAFDAAEVFPVDEGTVEVGIAFIDYSGLSRSSGELETLVMLYDAEGRAFFAIGMNAGEFSVGSFPAHPAMMEKVFGGTSFPYLYLLDSPPKDGDRMKVRVTWGKTPAGNRVYINGKYVDTAHREGPRFMGAPGFEPEETLSGYMHGFDDYDGLRIGPPAKLTVGKIGQRDAFDQLDMAPPTSVGIVEVRVWSASVPPEASDGPE